MIRKSFLASFISLATASLLLTGCNGVEGDTTSGIVTKIHQPTGIVTGTIQDTNGNPLEGVKVYLADKEVTSNVGGIYTFKDVVVMETVGSDASANDNKNQLSITVAAPTGYLGATVTVRPEAQIDDSSGDADADTVNSPNTTFMDGFMASAGVAVLPKLDATVTARIELASTEASVVGQQVALDLVRAGSGAATGQEQAQDGVLTTYATSSYTAITGEDGRVTFYNLPNDSTLKLIVGNYVVAGINNGTNPINTDDEVSIINLGDVQVNPIVNDDAVAPTVVGIVGEIDTASGRVMLNDDTLGSTTPFVIRFSEPLMSSQVDDNSVIVKDVTNPKSTFDIPVTATMSNDGRTLTLTTTADLHSHSIENSSDNRLFDINLLISDFRDKSGNYLVTTAPTTGIGYDSYITAQENDGTKNAVVRLQVQAFNELNKNANSPTNQKQLSKLAIATDDVIDLQSYSKAFTDIQDDNIDNCVGVAGSDCNVAGTAVVQNLNYFESTNGANTSDAEFRLSSLATAHGKSSGTVTTRATKVEFVPSGAAGYKISVADSKNNEIIYNATQAILGEKDRVNNIVDFDAQNNKEYSFGVKDATDVTPFTVYLPNSAIRSNGSTGLRPGDVVTITPFDDLGYNGTPVKITLKDEVAPTTVLQRGYECGGYTLGTAGVIGQSAGAQLANPYSDDSLGLPAWPITASLIDRGAYNVTASGLSLDTNEYIKVASYKLIADNEGGNGVNEPNAMLDEIAMYNVQNSEATSDDKRYIQDRVIYDATAWEKFYKDENLARTIGVAFSEDLKLVDATKFSAGTLTGSTLGSPQVINNAIDNVGNLYDYNTSCTDSTNCKSKSNDLVALNSSNVIKLANDGVGSVLDFTDAVSDLAGNIADSTYNAKVTVVDAMPPFVTKAEFATDLVVTFNEPVTIAEGTTELKIDDNGVKSYVVAKVLKNTDLDNPNYSLSADGKTLTIFGSGSGNPITTDSTMAANGFNLGKYAESAYGTTNFDHGALTWTNVMDSKGNSWGNTANCLAHRDDSVNIEPKFAIINKITDFIVTIDNNGFINDGSKRTQSMSATFTHPIDIANTFGVAAGTLAKDLSAVDILGNFTYILDNGTGQETDFVVNNGFNPVLASTYGIDTNTIKATLTNGDKVITISFSQETDPVTNTVTTGLESSDIIKYNVDRDGDSTKGVITALDQNRVLAERREQVVEFKVSTKEGQ